MNGKNIMNSLENIDDRFVTEFSEIKKHKKFGIIRYIVPAAVFIMIISVSVLLFSDNSFSELPGETLAKSENDVFINSNVQVTESSDLHLPVFVDLYPHGRNGAEFEVNIEIENKTVEIMNSFFENSGSEVPEKYIFNKVRGTLYAKSGNFEFSASPDSVFYEVNEKNHYLNKGNTEKFLATDPYYKAMCIVSEIDNPEIAVNKNSEGVQIFIYQSSDSLSEKIINYQLKRIEINYNYKEKITTYKSDIPDLSDTIYAEQVSFDDALKAAGITADENFIGSEIIYKKDIIKGKIVPAYVFYISDGEDRVSEIYEPAVLVKENEEKDYEEYFSDITIFDRYSSYYLTGKNDILNSTESEDNILRKGSDCPVNDDELKLEKDLLYIVDSRSDEIIKKFSDVKVSDTSRVDFSVQKEGVFVVSYDNKLIMLDGDGNEKKTVFSAEEGKYITDFLVKDKIAWVFCGNSIYRIYIPTLKSEIIVNNISNDDFLEFLYPISNYEIHWLQYSPEFSERAEKSGYSMDKLKSDSEIFERFIFDNCDIPFSTAYYINTSTGAKAQRDIYPSHTVKNIGLKWWMVPDDNFSTYSLYKKTLPDNFIEGRFNLDLSCGGGQFFTDYNENGGNPVGFTCLAYDIKPIFKDGKFIGVDAYGSKFNIKEQNVSNENIISEGTMQDYEAGDYVFEYNFAFYCDDENSPVYIFALRSDLYEKDVFNEICSSITKE